ncbi:hypothetical protein H310_10662 [Aphanomyces invadans]|uniref:Uncharacterized protein n=1 Tax=Aphanomyces invadans TaxID=157072 RepID=A0A024TPR6_9STRA|nr:hypothetical protein H310_10662 [Aphanomyces invadans]ETV96008.1 hypothetical protein H310_10662 [Aphanomyces invadans]|eukprot:XP_008875319.1 hypothetical protein H310_10662 [Aphanomyces invadans]
MAKTGIPAAARGAVRDDKMPVKAKSSGPSTLNVDHPASVDVGATGNMASSQITNEISSAESDKELNGKEVASNVVSCPMRAASSEARAERGKRCTARRGRAVCVRRRVARAMSMILLERNR